MAHVNTLQLDEEIRSGGADWSSDADGNVTHSYERVFKVYKSTPNERERSVLSSPGIPASGAVWQAGNEADDAAILQTKRATYVQRITPDSTIDPNNVCAGGQAWEWQVTCTYSSSGTAKPENDDQDPDSSEVDVQWSSESLQQVMERDINDKLVASSAGEVFRNPPFVRDVDVAIATITRIESGFTADAIFRYKNQLNLQEFFGAKPFHAKCADLGARREKGGKWSVTYVFKFWPPELDPPGEIGGWYAYLPDIGTYYKNASGESEIFEDAEGNARQGFLDGAGGALNKTADEGDKPKWGILTDGQKPVYLTFAPYDAVDFNELGLV